MRHLPPLAPPHYRRHLWSCRLPAPLPHSIHEVIGRGRQSKVYKARLKQSLEYVVVKACSKDLKPRVLQEVRLSGWQQAVRQQWLVATAGDSSKRRILTLGRNSVEQLPRKEIPC